ncbi:hypothetical protein L4D13_08055 [Photobacterium profundum]|uniref:hypothetical protein n=1 Tax=Photobacterium profundum TaxID=74109 RepID=UPI003D1002A3
MKTNIQRSPSNQLIYNTITPLLFTLTSFTSQASEFDEMVEQHNLSVNQQIELTSNKMDTLYAKEDLNTVEEEQLFQLENSLDELYETLM